MPHWFITAIEHPYTRKGAAVRPTGGTRVLARLAGWTADQVDDLLGAAGQELAPGRPWMQLTRTAEAELAPAIAADWRVRAAHAAESADPVTRWAAQIIAERAAALAELGRPAVSPPADARPTLSREAHAVALLRDHPEWSVRRIAQACGCSPATLYRSSLFTKARAAMRDASPPPRGRKIGGQIEAWDDDA